MGYIKSKATVSSFMVLGQCFIVVKVLPHVQCIITILLSQVVTQTLIIFLQFFTLATNKIGVY